MGETSIEWTDATWNPVTGCTKVSAGCKNCYAERIFPRAYSGHYVTVNPGERDQLTRPRKFTDVLTHEDRLEQPLHWRKPARVFVNSMSDLFHEDVPDKFIADVFSIMALTHWHTFQVLTKRPKRMREFVSRYDIGLFQPFIQMQHGGGITTKSVWGALDRKHRDRIDWAWPLPNVWLGVSVEDQRSVQSRVWRLRETPAAVRFISYEPALGPVEMNLDGIDWVIIGGESGPGARPFNIQWARDVIGQCRDAGVAAFFKQAGSLPIIPSARQNHWDWGGAIDITAKFENFSENPAMWRIKLKDRKGGDPSEWATDLRVREWPTTRSNL